MKVLYVEDNEQDADLTCRRLARLAPSGRSGAADVVEQQLVVQYRFFSFGEVFRHDLPLARALAAPRGAP